jgi:AmmeMemoRadiSam system protein B
MRLARTAPWIAAAAALTVAYTFGPMRAAFRSSPPVRAAGSIPQAHPLAFFDERTFALALARAERTPAEPVSGVRAILIPHHWFAADLIVQGLRNVAASGHVTRVVLMGPNHIGTGGATFATSRFDWQVPGGLVHADRAAIDGMAASGLAHLLPDVLSHEHSVAGLVPAVAYFFPGASVIPIAVHARPSPFELDRMAATLARLLADRGTVLVTSVDFSHYRSAAESKRRNAESIRAIASFDTGRILGFGNEHMDSPATIALLLDTMRLVRAAHFRLWADTNSSRFGGPSTAPNVTSYITGSFR